MQQTLKDLLQHNHSFLLVPNPTKGLGVYYNLYALYLGLEALDKSVDTYINHTQFTHSLQKSKGIKDLSSIDINDKNKIIVTLKDLNTEIDDIAWHKTGSGIELIINTKDKAPKGIKVQYKSPHYDKIILLDFDTTEEIEKIGAKSPELMEKEKFIVISSNTSHNPSYLYYQEEDISVGQQIYSFMKEFGIPINKTSATYTIAGIYHDTYGLTNNVNANTFKALSDLTNQNADLHKAIELANNNLSIVQAKLYSYIFAHINKVEPKTYYSVVKDTLLINELEKNFLHFDLVPLSVLANNEVTFICYEYQGISKFIFLQNRKGNTTWLSDKGYNVINTGKLVKATTKMPLSQALTDIINTLKDDVKKIISPIPEKAKIEVNQDTKTQMPNIGNIQTGPPVSIIKPILVNKTTEVAPNHLNQKIVESPTVVSSKKSSNGLPDPLAPATEIPEPIRFEKKLVVKNTNTPLPAAG